MLQVWKERFENLVILFDFLKEAFYSYNLTALPPFPYKKAVQWWDYTHPPFHITSSPVEGLYPPFHMTSSPVEGLYPPLNSHDLYRSDSIAINSYFGFTRDIYIDKYFIDC